MLAVVLPTPHGYSGTLNGGYSARFIASRRVSMEQEGFCTLQKQPRENTAHNTAHHDDKPITQRAPAHSSSGDTHTTQFTVITDGGPVYAMC